MNKIYLRCALMVGAVTPILTALQCGTDPYAGSLYPAGTVMTLLPPDDVVCAGSACDDGTYMAVPSFAPCAPTTYWLCTNGEFSAYTCVPDALGDWTESSQCMLSPYMLDSGDSASFSSSEFTSSSGEGDSSSSDSSESATSSSSSCVPLQPSCESDADCCSDEVCYAFTTGNACTGACQVSSVCSDMPDGGAGCCSVNPGSNSTTGGCTIGGSFGCLQDEPSLPLGDPCTSSSQCLSMYCAGTTTGWCQTTCTNDSDCAGDVSMVCVALNEQGFCYPSCGDQDQDYCAETYGSAFSCNVNDDVDGTYVYTCSTPQ